LADTSTETGLSSQGQFYQLADDLGETNNIAKQAAEKVQASETRLQELRHDGQSRQ